MENIIKLELNDNSINYLQNIRRWTLFFSILGFITIGILLLIVIFAKAILSAINPDSGNYISFVFILIYLIFTIINFFPIYYLYKFSVLSKTALNTLNNSTLQESLKYLKLHFQFIGILTIIILAFYFIGAVGYGLGMAFLS